MAVTIAEFLASVGFKADEGSLKAALAKVAGFGAAISLAAGAAFAGIMRVAEGEVALAKQAESLGLPIRKLEELNYVAEQTGASSAAVAAALGSLKDKYPHIKDTGKLLEQVGARMRGMSDQAAKLYAKQMGLDPALVPMLARDVGALKNEFAAMYDVAGRDAQQAAEDSKAFMAELGKLKTMSALLARAVGGAFLGRLRGDIEHLRRVVMENFSKIKRIFESVIDVVLRIAGAVGAFVRRVVTWASAIVGWYDRLDGGQKKIVQGLAVLLAAWKLLNAGFLATPLGWIVAGLAAIVALVDDYQTYMEGAESYFDWGPWAGTIAQVVDVLKRVWDALVVVGQAIAAGVGPALRVLNEQCRWVFNTIASLAEIIWKVFSGDFSGALEAARQMLADWAASGQAIWQAFCDLVGGFFGTLWSGITANFPDFAAWAENAANSIRNFFAPAVDWVKEKLRGLTDFMPDWLKEKMGLGGMNLEAPSGPALTPSPMQAQAASTKSSEVKVEAKTEIVVNGAESPDQVAGKVAGSQNRAAADMARHTQGAVR